MLYNVLQEAEHGQEGQIGKCDAVREGKTAMATKRSNSKPERISEEERPFWRGCFRTALADCLDIQRTPAFCAQIAGEVADASVREERRRNRK